jgi:hypothetical protein
MALFVLAGGKGARLDVEPGPATLLVVTGLMVGLAVLLVRRFPPAE